MWISQRVGRNTYISTGIGLWLVGGIFMVAIGATILFYGLIGIGVILLSKWLLRRWPWTAFIGFVWLTGMLVKLNAILFRAGGGGIAAAVVIDLVVGVVVLAASLARAPAATVADPVDVPLSESEQLRLM